MNDSDHESAEVGSGMTIKTESSPFPEHTGLPEESKPVTASTVKEVETVVETHNGAPLRNFSLHVFHPSPETVPQVLLQEHQLLKKYIRQSTCKYLTVWKLSSELDLLDLRFCAAYAEKLQGEYQFLGQLLSDVFKTTPIQDVELIKKLRLPQIELQPQATYANSDKPMPPHLQITVVLKALAEARCTITEFVLPIKCALQKSDVTKVEYRDLAAFFLKFPQIMRAQEGESGSKSTSAIKVTLACISKDSEAVIKDVQRKINDELKRSNPEHKLKIGYCGSKEECMVPTRAVFKGKSSVVEIHSAQLLGKCPLASDHTNDSAKGKLGNTPARKVKEETHKQNLMVTTDCVWSETDLNRLQFTPSQLWNLEQVHKSGTDGSGTIIAVVDTGINSAHCAFQNKILLVKNFAPTETDNFNAIIDSDGHGTLCAGIAAGESFTTSTNPLDPNAQLIDVPCGVAPGAQLIVCSVFKEGESGVAPKIVANALQWLVDYREAGNRLDVVSLSFGTTTYPSEIAHVISALVTMGVIVVCAASNDGRMRLQPISFPARLGHVLCIGAQDDQGKPTSFSPVGRELDFLAPGYQIIGPGPGTQGIFGTNCANGTSFATPAVAGLVCLVLHHISRICNENASDGRPIIDHVRNVWVMKEILKDMSSSPGHHAEELGYGTLIPSRIFRRHHLEIRRLMYEIIGAEEPSAKRKKT